MKIQSKILVLLLSILLFGGFAALTATADSDKVHKLAIHVDTSDLKIINMALNNATNVTKHYGVGEVDIVIVGYGPGLTMFKSDSKVADRLRALNAFGNVKFGVCKNTMDKMKLSNKDLISDAFIQEAVVPSGVVHLIELQEQGYSYVKP